VLPVCITEHFLTENKLQTDDLQFGFKKGLGCADAISMSQVETVLREEQAGLRVGRSCVDQIFTLRRILEQVLEHRSPLLITFVDFEKAFDSIDRESLWKIMATWDSKRIYPSDSQPIPG